MVLKFLIPAIVSPAGVGLDLMGNTLAQAYPDTPHWVWVLLFWISVALFSALPLWLVWRGVQLLRPVFATIEFVLPIRRIKEWPYNASIANRLYHARSYVHFNKLLDECRIAITLSFFNGSNDEIVVDRTFGKIVFDNIPDGDSIPTPRLEGEHPPPKIAPLAEFFVNFDQHVPKELAIKISDYLELGRSLSLNLTNLTILLRRTYGGDTFAAPLWHGINCTKKSNEIAVGKVIFASIRERPQIKE